MLFKIPNFVRDVFRKLSAFLPQTRNAKNQSSPLTDSAKRKRLQIQVEQCLEQWQSQDFAGLRKQFIFCLRPILPEIVLRKGWSVLHTMAGPVLSKGNPDISLGWFTDSARLPIQFKRAKLVMVMQFTKSGSVFGLRFLPQSLAGLSMSTSQVWRPPAYVTPDSYEEFQITLGSKSTRVGGVLTLPRTEENCPCLVLLAGSGPCDRDSAVQAAKPFKDLALGLAGKNVATIRFDKVTLTHGKRIAKIQTFTLTDEYVEHAVAALNFATKHPKIQQQSVFLVGHSLGAVVVPKISMAMPSVCGFILMAAPAQPLYRCAIRQLEYLSEVESGQNENENANDDEGLEELRRAACLADSPDLSTSTPAEKLPFGIGPRYWLDYKTFEPIGITRQTAKPVLILQGEQDYQVTMQDDYSQWLDAMESMPNVDLRSYQTLNHLFMSIEGKSTPSDYEKPCNVDFTVIEEIADWIRKQTSHTRGKD